MSSFEDQPQRMLSPYDRIAEELQQLRLDAGDVPYAEIVRRISRHRISQGVDPVASRPARSTVYDAFRHGRTRMNVELVSEIVRALNGTDEDIENWRNRCLQARSDQASNSIKIEDQRGPQKSEEPDTLDIPVSELIDSEKNRRVGRKLLLLAASVVVNLLGFWLVATLGVPLYLDMLGTAVAAMLLGPWAGVAVAVATNVLGTSITDSSSLAFILVNVTGALVWGYGIRWVRRDRSLRRYYLLTFLVALSCSVVATVLLVFVFNGATGHASEVTRANLDAFGMPMILSVFQSNLLYSLADKMLTGFLVLMVFARIKRWVKGSSSLDLEADITRRIRGEELST